MTEKIKEKVGEPIIKKQEMPIEPKKQDETRENITLTLDRPLIEELKRKSEKTRLSISRYVEITLRKALRLKYGEKT